MIRILVDSAADFLKEELAAKHMEMVPLTITLNDTENYRDELELSRAQLYQLLVNDGNTLKTSQPSPQDFLEKFEEIKACGDEVICIMLSSALSGTYQSAVLAKELVDYDKIYIIDSLTATAAIRIMANHAQKLIEEGRTAAEITEILEAMKSRLKIKAAVDTLKYLYLGGRVSKTTAIVADAVTIKPGIYVTEDGKVAVGSKYLGVARAVKDLARQLKTADRDTDFPLYLVYSMDDTNMQRLKKAINDAGIMEDGCYEIGATLGVHTGPGVFGAIYVSK